MFNFVSGDRHCLSCAAAGEHAGPGGKTVLHQMRAATLTSYVEVARFVGLDPFEMQRNADIRMSDLADPENRIAARLVVNLLEESARRSGCSTFGLLMAECRT